MQTDLTLSVKSAFHITYNREGLTGFFKGVQSPLATQPFVNATVFGAYELVKR